MKNKRSNVKVMNGRVKEWVTLETPFMSYLAVIELSEVGFNSNQCVVCHKVNLATVLRRSPFMLFDGLKSFF